MNKAIWLFPILLLAIFLIPSASATLSVTCDKDTYGVLSAFEAECQVNTTDSVDITVELPSLLPSASVEFSVLSGVSDMVTFDNYTSVLANETCAGVWEDIGGIYNCTDNGSMYNCLELYDGNTTCEYPIYTNEGTYDVPRSDYITSEYVAVASTDLGENKYRMTFNSDFSTTTFKVKASVMAGSNGKFNVLAKTATDSGELDPTWLSDYNYRRAITNVVATGVTPTGYQVKYVLGSSDVGVNYNWSNECVNSNSTKSRLANPDGVELPFWVESCSISGKNMTAWVKSDQPINTTGYDVYLYYDSDTAVPMRGNASAVFEFFDDASTDQRYLYNTYGVPAGTFTWVNKTEYRLWSSISNIEVFILSKQQFNATKTPYKLISSVLFQPSARNARVGVSNTGSSGIMPFYMQAIYTSNQQNFRGSDVFSYIPPYYGCSTGNIAGHLDGVYHVITITSNGTGTSSFVDGSLYKSCYTPQYTPNAPNRLYAYTYKWNLGYASIMYIDYWIVAKHYSPEPTYTIGAEETFGYTIEFDKFAGGNETILLHGNETTSFFVSPEVTYETSQINLTGTMASPYPLNPRVYVGDTLVWNYTGNFSSSVMVVFNVSIINNWLLTHPSGQVPVITYMDNEGGMLMTDLLVKGTSPTPVLYCDGSQYYDPITQTCREGYLYITSEAEKKLLMIYVNTTTSNYYDLTDPIRYERENSSLPVIIDAQVYKYDKDYVCYDVLECKKDKCKIKRECFTKAKVVLNVTETNAKRVSIDFNRVSLITGTSIYDHLLDKKTMIVFIKGDGIDDFAFIDMPEPLQIFKNGIPYTGWSYDLVTKTLTIPSVHMSDMTWEFTFGEATEVRQDFILGGILPLLIGIGLLLFVVTTAFSFGETQTADPKEALKEILGNAVGIVVILMVVATALYMYLGLPLY